MKITILCISDSDKHFAAAIQEYEKRLGKEVSVVNLKPIKHGTPEQIIEKETQLLREKLEHKTYHEATKILLSKEGKPCTTQAFHALCVKYPFIVYIVGGPYGLNEAALAPYIDQKISFGKQTMPHGLAKLVLLEQVYRSSMIAQNRSYHY